MIFVFKNSNGVWGRGRREGVGGEVAQIMYTHMNKCINNKKNIIIFLDLTLIPTLGPKNFLLSLSADFPCSIIFLYIQLLNTATTLEMTC
jgi:hypothetical protein